MLIFPALSLNTYSFHWYYLESLGFKVAYTKVTVFQDRNVQNLTTNLVNEYIGYENTIDLLKKLKEDPENIYKFLPDEAEKCLKKYLKISKNIIDNE